MLLASRRAMLVWLAWCGALVTVVAAQDPLDDTDSEQSRKVLGSSVVTSVSVIMDHGNGTKTYIADAIGQPIDQTEGAVGSPVDLLNPDRYEFYTFDETGDLVKKLMTLDQIKGLLAGGDGESLDNTANSPTFFHDSLSSTHLDDSDLEPNMAQGVHNVVANVQNVLRNELKASKIKAPTSKPPLNIPDSISSWSMLFPAIISDAEALADGNDSGNSVNDPIDSSDILPAQSVEKRTEVKLTPEETNTMLGNSDADKKPTAVPPIIHFLEIQSVPSKKPTKNPVNNTSTTPVTAEISTTMASTTTEKPTSEVNSIKEMSASISNLLSQMTDKPSAMDASSESELSVTTSSYVTDSIDSLASNLETKSSNNKKIPALKPESSNVQTVTTNLDSKESNSQSKVTSTTESNNLKVSNNKNNDSSKTSSGNINTSSTTLGMKDKIKTTSDPVVSLITTSKPMTTSKSTTMKQSSSPEKPMAQIKSPTTLKPSALSNKNHSKIQPTAIPTQSSEQIIKGSNVSKHTVEASDMLGADASEEILKIIPNKPPESVTEHSKIKLSTSTKLQMSNNTSTVKPSTKPHKKVPTNKPHHTENTPDCANSKKTSNVVDSKNSENIEGSASSNLNERIKPSKINLTSIQEVKQKVKSDKPTTSKTKISEEVKITTYKPSTSQPFTTKQSTNKISTTTEKPLSPMNIGSESKVHEVNSSLFDIKSHETNIQNNISIPSTKSKENVTINMASSVDETEVVENETKQSEVELKKISPNISPDNLNHSAEIDCKHHTKPLETSNQNQVSNMSNNDTASASEDETVTMTTPSVVESTSIYYIKETTLKGMEDNTTLMEEDDSTTTMESNSTTTSIPETATLNMPDTDFVKEGISAVTNILLDLNPPLEPQVPFPTIPLAESASNIVQSPPVKGELKHASSFDDLEMTTVDMIIENVTEFDANQKNDLIYFTTGSPMQDSIANSTDYNEADSITTTSTEEITENFMETTTLKDESSTFYDIQRIEVSETNILQHIKSNQTFPTKESKLSPENESVEPPCNHTLIASQFNKTKNASGEANISMDIAESKENLESAQSIIQEVSKKNSLNKIEPAKTPTSSTDTVDKNTLNNGTLNQDLKTGLKKDTLKLNQGKFPNIQNQFRPLQDTPINPPTAVELHPAPHESMGLEATTAFLADDVRRFSDLCNELAFRMWTSITGKGSISSRSLVLSPFATTSLLAMVFLGARGPTSGQMNDVLRLDDMVTFNPHQVLQNVTESVLNSRNYGVTTAAFVRELYSDKLKGKILDFYKERAQQYYDGHVEEIAFNAVGDILRRRTNLLVKRQTLGKIPEYLRGSNLNLRPPLAAFSANIFQTDCDLASTEGRDGEMYFVVRPSTRQRRLVPVPAAVWRTGFLAGYEPGLDATAVALGTDSVVSTILVLPGQQGQVAPGDGLARLEQRLIETSYRRGGWTRLLRSLLPRPGLELQVPRFSHRSVLNVTSTLQRMGLKDLFNEQRADLRGLNGLSNDLHLSEMVQVNTFSTCGEDTIGARHHIETYPVSPQRMGRDDPELYPRPEDFEDSEILKVPLNLRPRQARLPDNPRLRFDRPFLYMVRHNPTGMILHMGRFNPRLLP